MRAVIQRVARARVVVDGEEIAAIAAGLLVLVGVARDDDEADVSYVAGKIAHLRILDDAEGRLNRSVLDAQGAVLLVSQFTLLAETRKGRRPSFTRAAPPDAAERLLDDLAHGLRARGVTVHTGKFRAMMDVELVNQGPVTIVIDSDERNIPRRQA